MFKIAFDKSTHLNVMSYPILIADDSGSFTELNSDVMTSVLNKSNIIDNNSENSFKNLPIAYNEVLVEDFHFSIAQSMLGYARDDLLSDLPLITEIKLRTMNNSDTHKITSVSPTVTFSEQHPLSEYPDIQTPTQISDMSKSGTEK